MNEPCNTHDLQPSEQPWRPGAQMLANRLRKNLKTLGRWARRHDIHCYRLYDADLPEYALAIDIYECQQRWVHVQEYEAPKSIPASTATERLRDALAVIPEVLGIPQQQLSLKVRRRQRGSEQYEKHATTGSFHEVSEQGCRFWVNFSDYLDTGLFLDHRTTRSAIAQRTQGKRFLNLFCYTGSATVHAVHGGAATTTSVDLSNTYLDWARKNMDLNRITGSAHRLIQADCLQWLQQQAVAAREHYDVIFLDPPTFSNSKRMQRTFDVQRDHKRLIEYCLNLLAPAGELIFSTNCRAFKLASFPYARIQNISHQTLPKDFERNPRIHQCWIFTQN